MTPPRFQFTIRGLMTATFWVAAGVAAFCFRGPTRNWDLLPLPAGGAITGEEIAPLLLLSCLCVAGGALIGRHRLGLLIGLFVLVGWFAWVGLYGAGQLWHG